MKTIKVTEWEEWWRCGDGCCDSYETYSIFEYEGKTYKYQSGDSYFNLKSFIEDILGVEFNIEYGKPE